MKKLCYGKVLIELRKTKNVSQKEVAEALAISRPTYISWESDCGDLPISKLILLSVYYEISVHIIIQMIYDANRLSQINGNVDATVLKNDIYSIKKLLTKYN